jgi:hypothetical protein
MCLGLVSGKTGRPGLKFSYAACLNQFYFFTKIYNKLLLIFDLRATLVHVINKHKHRGVIISVENIFETSMLQTGMRLHTLVICS